MSIQKPSDGGSYIGATEQNVLKLFGWMIESPSWGIDTRLPEPTANKMQLIY